MAGDVAAYLDELVARLRAHAGERLADPTPVRKALARRDDPTAPPLTAGEREAVVRRAEAALH
ncbi:MAG TPA: hypothetical protein VGJ32_13255 [Solirubrobacteraceae bacterium]